MKPIKVTTIIIILLSSYYLSAQVSTYTFQNADAFINFPFLNQIEKESIPLIEMPSFNLDSVIAYENKPDESILALSVLVMGLMLIMEWNMGNDLI